MGQQGGECGEGNGSRKLQPPRSPFTGRTDGAAGPLPGSRAHAPLPGSSGGEQGGPASGWGLGGRRGAGMWRVTCGPWRWPPGQVGRKKGSVGPCLCTCCAPNLGLQPHPSPSSSPSTGPSRSGPFWDSCSGSHVPQPSRSPWGSAVVKWPRTLPPKAGPWWLL